MSNWENADTTSTSSIIALVDDAYSGNVYDLLDQIKDCTDLADAKAKAALAKVKVKASSGGESLYELALAMLQRHITP